MINLYTQNNVNLIKQLKSTAVLLNLQGDITNGK